MHISSSRAALAARKPFAAPGFSRGMARADGTPSLADVLLKIGQVQQTVAEFKAKNDQLETEIKKGREDVVTKNAVDAINADITKLSAELQDMNSKLATARALGKSENGQEITPERAAYNKAFMQYFRKGVDAGLDDLAIRAAISTDSNPDGGYAIPVEMDQAISRVYGSQNAMRGLATVTPVNTDTLTVLHNLGGANCGWVSERASRTETNTAQLAKLEFKVHEIYAAPVATQQALDDAFFSIDSWIQEEVNIAMAEEEGAKFIRGSGVGQPYGLVDGYATAASTVSSPSAWGKVGYTVTGVSGDFVAVSASANGIDNLIDLRASLKPGYVANARWVMNRSSAAKCRKLKANDGTYVWQESVALDVPSTLLGHPVTIDDNMYDFGANSFPIAFGDFARAYKIVDRMGTRLIRDNLTRKPYVIFYMTKRVGGGIRDFHAVKLLKAGTS